MGAGENLPFSPPELPLQNFPPMSRFTNTDAHPTKKQSCIPVD